MGIDALPFKHPLNVGFYGTYGLRGPNFTVANSDLLIVLGSRLDVRQTGNDGSSFARAAQKIVVDIDPQELNQRIKTDYPISADLKIFLTEINSLLKQSPLPKRVEWIEKTQEWKNRYPATQIIAKNKQKLSPYTFMTALSQAAPAKAVIIPDAGGNLMWLIQCWQLKKGQRLFSAGGMSPMGYSLPAALGAAKAVPNQPIICTIGDGGLQMNIQELQTMAIHSLPIKLFIINNHCYGIIRQFQRLYLKGNYQASGPESGYFTPDFLKIAKAYQLPVQQIDQSTKNLKNVLKRIIQKKGPVVVNVEIEENSEILPKLEYLHPLEDTIPYLPRKEFYANMLIKPLK
jgi:acetolactate synthase-1/2/3 large subunit